MAESPVALKCLLLPMDGPGVLVPSALVAEIVHQKEARPVDGASEWLIGMADWRGAQVPLISFERLCNIAEPPVDPAGRYVILFSFEPDQTPAYYGFYIATLPRSETVRADDLEGHESDADDPPVIAAYGRLGDRECIVPNLDAVIETLRAELR